MNQKVNQVNKTRPQHQDLSEAHGILEGPARDGGVDMLGWVIVGVIAAVIFLAGFLAGWVWR